MTYPYPLGLNLDCPENHIAFEGHCYIPSFLDKASNKTIYKEDDCFDNFDNTKCNRPAIQVIKSYTLAAIENGMP